MERGSGRPVARADSVVGTELVSFGGGMVRMADARRFVVLERSG
jgi:hypothetical protein